MSGTPNTSPERAHEFEVLACRDCGAQAQPFWWLIDREALTVTCPRCLGTDVRHNGHAVAGHPWLALVAEPLTGVQLEASRLAAKAHKAPGRGGRVRHGGGGG
jgi:hypothetical protein